ncbi:WD40-repeat-containing domain protein [Thelephora terrestris]|uniref:WD40-repeat-containing domain protein n=1 Tax=Thelephora terrestris TaxID=56493 RepID=A0A9P6L8H5_9AGAM|nr:WD40-repeat-containing domain protein [Thelephora terrestris]
MYRHILPFCPLSSWLHEFYTSESLGEVKVVKGCPDKWGTCNRVVVPRGDPEALVYWKDMIAVGLRSGDIMILDAITGSSRSDFSGHEGSVVCLTFSPDGTLLVSGSVDATLRLWDIQTGGVMRTFRDKACSVAISSDAITIASGGTHTVRLWEVRTGACHRTIDVTPGGTVACLDFLSTVPGRLMSISGGVVQQWDVNGTETGPKFSGHHISFSSDGKHFVLCDEGPPTIRDTVSGKTIATLLSTGRDFSLCCFSPGDQFVAGVANETVYVWDITDTPLLIETFTPHSSSIFSLVYSPSLVSTHSDGGIRFQRIYGGSLDSTTNKTKSMATSRARIIYTTLQAEKGIAISVDSAGTIERWDLSTGLPEVLLRVPGTEHVIGARLADSELTIVHRDHSFDSGWRVSTWDVGSGKMLRGKSLSGDVSTLDPTLNRDLGISKDGKTFFVVDPVNIRTWSISTGESTGSSSHRSYTRTSISVSLDGPIIWIRALGRSQAWGWDSRDLKAPPLDTSEIPKTLRLACPHARGDGGSSGQSRIVDTTSGAEVFRLSGGFKNPGKAVWDGRYLCVGYGDGELLILDFVHMTLR